MNNHKNIFGFKDYRIIAPKNIFEKIEWEIMKRRLPGIDYLGFGSDKPVRGLNWKVKG